MTSLQPLRILLAGGSGQVGPVLTRHFLDAGHRVTVLSRGGANPLPGVRGIQWNGRNHGSWAEELENTDILINLCGRSVNCRYTRRNHKEILESRVQSTTLLGAALEQCQRPPRLWMNASTATIYRNSLDRDMDELTGEIGGADLDVPDEWGFSIEVAKKWEEAFFSTRTPLTRKLALRSAMTMSTDRGGVFDAFLRIVRFGLGGALGNGEQYVSWIHSADFVRAIDFLIANEALEGPINLASPGPLPNGLFMRKLREASGVRVGLPASKWMLEIGALFLGTETELLLKSRRVVPTRLLQAGFQFQFPDWGRAARHLFMQWKDLSSGAKPGETRMILGEEKT